MLDANKAGVEKQLDDNRPFSRPNPGPDSPQWAVQVLLAAILDAPDRQAMALLQEKFPGRDIDFYAGILKSARGTIEQLIGNLAKATTTDPSPTLIDRLSFSWAFLRQADVLVWRLKKADFNQYTGTQAAAFAFRTLLNVPLLDPLLDALLRWLRLGPDARYLFHYNQFRRAKRPVKLSGSFANIVKNRDVELLRTLIWWCIRARKEEYIETRPNEPVRIEFPFLLEKVLEDVKGWAGAGVDEIADVPAEVELEVDKWLRYSRLELSLEDGAAEGGPDPEIARAFVKHNDLTTKLHIYRSDTVDVPDQRVRQLESTIRQYAEENRALEERIRVLEKAVPATTSPRTLVDSDTGTFSELREVLKTIDTKYAFDTLNAVQAGDDTHLTLRSFVSHLFYALRKRGFSEYPKEDEFTLTYEASGLFDCEGFEVPPSGSVPVRVTRKGWALNVRGRWLPVRRARVAPNNNK